MTVEQSKELKDLIRDTQSDPTRFLKHFKAESVDALPEAKYEEAKRMLLAKGKG